MKKTDLSEILVEMTTVLVDLGYHTGQHAKWDLAARARAVVDKLGEVTQAGKYPTEDAHV